MARLSFQKISFSETNLMFGGLGREPNRIEIMSEVKGIKFQVANKKSKTFDQDNLKIGFIHL